MRLIQKMLSNSVAARWYQMGVVLGVPPSDLEIIRESPEFHGAGEREAGMLKAWLERGILPHTWQVCGGVAVWEGHFTLILISGVGGCSRGQSRWES